VGYIDRHLALHSSALWSDDPAYARTEKLLRDSGLEAIAVVVAEKREAERVAAECVVKLDTASEHFDAAEFAQLRGYFENAQEQARIGQLWARTYWALRWYRNTNSPEARTELDAAVAACEASRFAERLARFVADVKKRK
jgi:hypothetical protein